MRRILLPLAFFALTGCPQNKCDSDADCEDQNPCTDDVCSASECQNTPNNGAVPTQNAADDCQQQVCQNGAVADLPNDAEIPAPGPSDDCLREACLGGASIQLPSDNETPPQVGADCLAEVCLNGNIVGEPVANGCNANQYCDADEGCQESLVDLNANFGDAIIFGSASLSRLTDFTGLTAGDLTGDGIADIAASQPDVGNGEVHIISGPHNGTIDLSNNPGIIISGAAPGDRLGLAIASCDFNGDGDADLLMSASGADPNGISGAGVLVGLLGPINANVDLAQGADLIINGIQLDAAGPDKILCDDLTGDGIDDIIAGVELADAPNRGRAGAVFLFAGSANLTGTSTVSQADLTILGHSPEMRLGGSLAIGDIDADSRADLIIGAPRLNPNASTLRPEKLVMISNTLMFNSLAPSLIDLVDPNWLGANADYIDGGNREQFAFSLVSADFDGDTIDDIAIGSLLADPLGRQNAGDVAVVYGQPNFVGFSIDAEPGRRTTIAGFDDNDETGISMAAGEHNGDGFTDLLVGAHTADGFNNARQDSGEVFLFLGGSIFNAGDSLDLRTTSVGLVIFGRAAFSSLGKQLQMFDLNSDGKSDLLLGAPLGDGPANSPRQDAGEISIILAP
jgi:hypothetical protein